MVTFRSDQAVNTAITLAYGDGIGPEVIEAALQLLRELEVNIHMEVTEIGRVPYERGHSHGMMFEGVSSLERTHILLKGPTLTPDAANEDIQHFKPLIPTLRRTAQLHTQVILGCIPPLTDLPAALSPLDILLFRPYLPLPPIEKDEGQKAKGEEATGKKEDKQEKSDSATKAKAPSPFLTKEAADQLLCLAFGWAENLQRTHVTLVTGDTEGVSGDIVLQQQFSELANAHRGLQADIQPLDHVLSRLIHYPDTQDVLIGDYQTGAALAATLQMHCSPGCTAATAHMGNRASVFEPLHQALPDQAERGTSNPSGAILAVVLLLTHLDMIEKASQLFNSWKATLESGCIPAMLQAKTTAEEIATTTDIVAAIIEKMHPAQ